MNAVSIEDPEKNNTKNKNVQNPTANSNENTNLIFGNVDREKNKKEQKLINIVKQRKIGQLKCFLFINGEPLIVIGPHWPFFACLFSINLIIIIVLFNFLYDKVNAFVYILGVFISLVQLGSYAYTAISNPGIPKACYETDVSNNDGKNMRRCQDCHLLIDTGLNTFHCYECEICIEGFDHHCPWTSKCIGRGNLKPFYIFIAFTMIMFGFLIFSVTLISPNYNPNY